jgi:hypothetical protein
MLARQIVIGLCIAFILPLVVFTGVNVFYPEPKASDYLTQPSPLPADATAQERQEVLAKQQSERKSQQAAYSQARKAFTHALILIAAPVGIVAILVGSAVPLNAIGTGLIAGGILSIALGYGSDWDNIDPLLRFISLLGGLIILLLLGLRQHRRIEVY